MATMNLANTIARIETVRKLAQSPFAFPGGYRIHFLTDDCDSLCGSCVADPSNPCHLGGNPDGWRIEAEFVHWEGEPISCAHCDTEFDSEYGDPS